MSLARIAILVIALLGAVAAAVLVRGFLTGGETRTAEAAPTPRIEMVDVLVASGEVAPGVALGASQLRWQAWPRDAVHASFIQRGTDEHGFQRLDGAVSRTVMLDGEPVTEGKIVRGEGSGILAATLRPGMRAISIGITAETGAGGFILPNDRVDVILTARGSGGGDGGTRERFAADTILEDVRVLAIDQTFRDVEGKQVVVGRTATLELTPGQAQRLVLADAMGDLALSLRGLGDRTTHAAADDAAPADGAVRIYRYGRASTVAAGE